MLCELLFVTAMHRQLFIDDYLEDSFEDELKFDLFENVGLLDLVLGAEDSDDNKTYFIGCMRNLAIQFMCVECFTKVC